MKLKYIKTLIFVTIFVVFAAGSIYNYMKRSAEPADIIKVFDKVTSSAEEVSSDMLAETSEPISEDHETGLVNINTAGRSELESLPGIGPVKAGAIMEYRAAYGGFVAPEEIMEVKGIGPATYEKIKDRITL